MTIFEDSGKVEADYKREKKLVKYINKLSKIERLLLFAFYMQESFAESDGDSFWIDDVEEQISIKDIKKYLKKFKQK